MTACCDMLDVIELGRMPWRNSVARTRPNEYNMKHPQVLHEKFDNFQTWANNTCRNTSQQGCQTRTTSCDRLAGGLLLSF